MDAFNQEAAAQFVKKKQAEIDLDPTESIDKVTPSMMMDDDYPGTGKPPFPNSDDQFESSKYALVCPFDDCHWQPCDDCDPGPWKCRFDERHPIHLRSRTLFSTFLIPDEEGNLVTVTQICRCHPSHPEYKQW